MTPVFARSSPADARVVKSMAKKPNSSANDPAALAFSAVEDALKDSVFNLDENPDDRTPRPQLRDNPQRTLMSALGPGFSTAFLMLNP